MKFARIDLSQETSLPAHNEPCRNINGINGVKIFGIFGVRDIWGQSKNLQNPELKSDIQWRAVSLRCSNAANYPKLSCRPAGTCHPKRKQPASVFRIRFRFQGICPLVVRRRLTVQRPHPCLGVHDKPYSPVDDPFLPDRNFAHHAVPGPALRSLFQLPIQAIRYAL